MKLYLNNEQVDFALEAEKNLEEVYGALLVWLYNRGIIITSAAINENPPETFQRDELKQIPVEEVETLKLQVKPAFEENFERLQTVRQYLATIHRSLESGNFPLFRELMEDYPIVEDELDKMLKPRGENLRNSDVVLLSGTLKNSSLTDPAEGAPLREQGLKLLEVFIGLLDERIYEITSPIDELTRIGNKIDTVIRGLEDVPVQLQTGKDRDAMKNIIEFTEMTQKIARIFPALQAMNDFDTKELTIGGFTIQDFYQDLNSILNEISHAFASKDSVLIGDLLEYETAPRLRQLEAFIRELRQE